LALKAISAMQNDNLVEIRIPKKLDEEQTENLSGILISTRLAE
jgi:hypothetical protein